MATYPSLWSLSLEKLYEKLHSSEQGLTSVEAEKRRAKNGLNEIAKKERRHGLHIFFSQFKSLLILILILAAVTSFFLGDRISASVILFIILINSFLGFFQEYKAERIVRELRKYVALKTNVLRDGQIKNINSKEIVSGDMVYLNSGDIVPADIRLIELNNLSVNESSLTGESTPIQKTVLSISAQYKLPQDLKNMVFMGTTVTNGTAKGMVLSIGKNTVFGQSASYLKKEELGDFQKSVHAFSNFLFKIVVVMTLFIFLVNTFLHQDIVTSFLFAIALAVGITPEVLPIIMTITLSKGAIRMAKESVIVKRLSSVEDFGNIDVLCCDKTGTLTEGKLFLQHFVNLEGQEDKKVLLYAVLSSKAKKQNGISYYNNPIDQAICEHQQVSKMSLSLNSYLQLSECAFDFERRRASVLVKKMLETHSKNHFLDHPENILLVKGASESVLDVCTYLEIKGKKISINSRISQIKTLIESYEKKGYKSLAIAKKSISKTSCSSKEEHSLTLVGFLFFFDTPKKTAKKSLQMLKRLNVAIKVITGDSPIITRKICQEVNLKIAENKIITGEELSSLNHKMFKEYCQKYTVFSRVSPEQKYNIIKALKEQGHIVGFLGDGINDAPALHLADVGISVDTAAGIAKEAANIILLKKSLLVLAHGIIEGRKTFGNITKYILNTISANYGNMLTVAASSIFLKFIPLLPVQILLNNFLSDFPLLTISTDKVDEQFLKKPKHWNLKLISRFMIFFGIISSFFDLLLIFSLIFVFKASPELFRTSWFILSLLSEVLITFAIRTRLSFFKSRPSRLLIITSVLTILFSILIININWGSLLFSFVSIPVGVWVLIISILIAYFTTIEWFKRYFFKKMDV